MLWVRGGWLEYRGVEVISGSRAMMEGRQAQTTHLRAHALSVSFGYGVDGAEDEVDSVWRVDKGKLGYERTSN